ncbi:MAG TPA: head-tail adaptor protein [Aurantimonas coralicida]|uniref:Head-tail adaptor protein n=2 Tax=root TaxID=1 RepID=A0A9C9TJ95_9HYPH|nr:head-tail adaptor protein [Aurantimonas coralicida]HEU02613.1 head-tail adaptor protein [Aurantimonas coralicida]
MRAGKLDRVIVIEGDAEEIGRNAFNEPIYGPPFELITRASVEQQSGREFLTNQSVSAERQVVFRTRYVEGITVLHRVIYDGVTHDIVDVREIGRSKGLELHTKASV